MSSPDIFISYAREDRATAQSLADVFTAAGRKVWWDREIQGGAAFATEIQKALSACRLVVVLWSQDAVASDFVRDEARRAMRAGKLLPVFIADVEPPLGFGETHALSLVGWDGSPDNADLAEVLRQTAERLDGVDTSPPAGPRLPGAAGRRFPAAWLGAGAAIAATVAAALWYGAQDRAASRCAPPYGAPVWETLEEGHGLLVTGDLAAARATFNRILSGEKDFARARYYLAQVLIQTGENEIARGLLAQVLRAVGTRTDCGIDAGELRKMGDWLATLESADDEPAPLPARTPALAEAPAPAEEPAPSPDPASSGATDPGDGFGSPAPPPPPEVFRPAFGVGDRPRARIAPPAPKAQALQAAVEAALGTDADRRVAATTGIVVEPESVSDAVPLAVSQALRLDGAAPTPDAGDGLARIVNALVLLQSATPATLNANRRQIEPLLAMAQAAGGAATAQADKVESALREARERSPVVYIQIADGSQRPFATAVATRLRAAGYQVPAFEIVGSRAPARATELRIQGRSDRELARWMAQQLERLGAGEITSRSLRKVNPANDTYELWLARDLCTADGPRPAACRGGR